ncbi:hypothetical protein NPIL_508321, partial [Nephila pilipes]
TMTHQMIPASDNGRLGSIAYLDAALKTSQPRKRHRSEIPDLRPVNPKPSHKRHESSRKSSPV